MKFQSTFALALSASAALALSIPKREAEQLFTVELAPGETKQVTEAQKWELHNAGVHFMDITDYSELHEASLNRRAVAATFPAAVSQKTSVTPLIAKLSTSNMQTKLTTFSNFQNRYYKSSFGKQSSEWLLSQVQAVVTASGVSGATVRAFSHPSWTQNSVIATIPGKSTNTIVIGAHQDSVNGNSPAAGRAPGADDDGSGTFTILEALRVLLTDSRVASGQAPNTIEFHWYAAEEGGLLGSQAIFTDYKNKGKVVKAMLQQDMTGYVKPGVKESVGVITDFVDAGLTTFIKKVITAYCTIPFVETKCGYACSDHASASKAGYPSAFVIESAMDDTSKFIHTAQDTLSTISFSHMLEHAKLTVGLAYELGFATAL
ncbi:Zn-dependent exopeptidase [Cucurbitaria berberidis CBS 394.84]|uniref:Peptide hydrolase n=1 Tax=Cucurbitaria berberidis CBS 394.84 TaxID=1168544 RepID=A0A9P4GH81_9PLEO|nr:Zn-dependent exopeptidase [Cucurbitaria berberidis CBS 394.84]KAF1845110.1 Zn-dependent exopeptidase [Cucurbitaria berberidis CBS 394.84]